MQEYLPNPIAFRNDVGDDLTEGNWMPSGIAVDNAGAVLTRPRSYLANESKILNAAGDTKLVMLEGATTAIVQIWANSVPVGFNMAFEATTDEALADGIVGWVPVPAVRTSTGTAETATGVLNAVPAYAWRIDTRGFTAIRLRVTAKTAGAEQVLVNVCRA